MLFRSLDKTPILGCTTMNLPDCMPVALKSVSGHVADLANDSKTQVYLSQTAASSSGPGVFQYLQTADGTAPTDATATQFHRLIVVEPLKDPATNTEFNTLRVSSMVFWKAAGDIDKKVVLTSELTDWK